MKMYTLKFNFAGSGDIAWRKATFDGKISTNQQNDLFKLISDKKGEEQYQVIDEKVMAAKYGKMIYPFIWVREKEKMSKKGYLKVTVEYTLPGCLGKILWVSPSGLSDSGNFSIANTKKAAIPKIKEQVDEYLKEEDAVIWLKIKGHSRGGVAANLIVQELQQVYNNHERVKICSVTFDPVPGSSWVSDRNADDGNKYDEITLFSGQNAVVYSMNSGYVAFFSPQVVKNAKVIVITPEAHDAGLYKVAQERKSDGTVKYKKKGYSYKNKEYSPGKLYKLPKGLYFVNSETEEVFELIKVDPSNYKRVSQEVKSKADSTRKDFLCSLVEAAGTTGDLRTYVHKQKF